MIDSVKTKAKELTVKSPGSNLTAQSISIVSRYDKLKDKAAVRNLFLDLDFSFIVLVDIIKVRILWFIETLME